MGRNRSASRSARAFAPAAITNFFCISYAQSDSDGATPAGATGGGYILSKGAVSTARLEGAEGANEIRVTVNGDPEYDARTTRRALKLLIDDNDAKFGLLELLQRVDVPIGSGFGASAASAISAVLAAGSVLGIKKTKRELAVYAHWAELIEKTGLGTVSVTYDATGAGAITSPGEPGVARFLNVEVPVGTRIVTASLAPYDKERVLSSPDLSERVNRLGTEALKRFMMKPSLESLGRLGETFAQRLGLASPDVTVLKRLAKSSGARFASQNMIGDAVHAITDEGSVSRVVSSLKSSGLGPRIDVFEIGRKRARVLTRTAG